MTNGDETSNPSHSAIMKAAREARLAQELRANLMKRKALKRSRTPVTDGETETAEEQDDTVISPDPEPSTA